MKLLFRVLTLLAILALQGCASPRLAEWRAECARKFQEDRSCIPFNATTPMYELAADGYRARTITEYGKDLDHWLPGQSPPLLFVHGRGKEPTKSLLGQDGFAEGQALLRLTERGLRPRMFNWDSAAMGLDRNAPLSSIPAAAAEFTKVLKVHADLRTLDRNLPRPVLLVHSMGALVIQRVVEDGGWPAQGQLFERIVFSEPDADQEGHEVWMSKLALREDVWVTWNQGDLTLNFAFDARGPGVRPLGLGVKPNQHLATGVHYVDLSRMGSPSLGWFNHVVYVSCSFGPAPAVDDFMGRLLAGKAIDPAKDDAVREVDAHGVIRLKD
ncbi:alpha/beta hydrolase [Roseateles sp. NT4]|uniref:alpha/beta hydrolase n=1 Tax=Roseateles sp. NT4 TaxID=3453715 RepID=UPI003EEC4C27